MAVRLSISALFFSILGFMAGCQAPTPVKIVRQWSPEVEASLVLARANRPQLERVLEHYREADQQKWDAACFLIHHMRWHSFELTHWVDEQGREVAFDALQYRSLREASAALDKLSAQHGKVRSAIKENRLDLQVVTAEYLIDHIDRAFAVYRSRPWCKNLPFDLFCEYILPYRSTNEPLAAWRGPCEIPVEQILARMKDPTSLEQAEGAVTALSPYKVGFNDLYYLNRTDLGFDEMAARKVGRCEDQQTMRVYLLRANGIPVAGDYTPFWGTRDNNHAWDTVLDAKGFGRTGLSSVPAKIFRKTFSRDPDGLSAAARDDAPLPRQLAARTYRDVTLQYVRAKDVTASLTVQPATPQRFAYAAVFNGGQWRIVHWGRIANQKVTFTQMGYGVIYLPVYSDGNEDRPAGPPVVVSDVDGSLLSLDSNPASAERLRASLTDRVTLVSDAGDLRLQVWADGWVTLAEGLSPQTASALAGSLPAGRLYWLSGPRDATTARIFTIIDGKPKYW